MSPEDCPPEKKEEWIGLVGGPKKYLTDKEKHISESLKTAEKLNLEQGDIIELISSTGKIKLPVFPHPAVHPKVIGVPIGLGHKFSGRYAAGKGVNVLKLCHTKLDHSQTFSWAENTVKIKKTQDSKTIAKFEGTLPGGAVAVEPGVPILTVGPNQTADDALHEAHEEHMEETFKDKNIK